MRRRSKPLAWAAAWRCLVDPTDAPATALPIRSKRNRVATAIAVAAIVAVGIAASAAVLLADRHGAGDTHDDVATTPSHVDEGHIRLSAEQIAASGIVVRAVGPGTVRSAKRLPGELKLDEDHTAHVVPRLAGIVDSVSATLGQRVRQGQVLAVISSAALSDQRSELRAAQIRQTAARLVHDRERRLWLEQAAAEQDVEQARTALEAADLAVQNATQKLSAVGAAASGRDLGVYEIRAPFDGTIVARHLTRGEAVKDDASIFTLSDLRTVWAELAVPPAELASLAVGQQVAITSTANADRAEGRIVFIGAVIGEQTRSAMARVALANPDGRWRPGLYVSASVAGADQPVPLAVDAAAVVEIDGRATVFKAVPEGFVAVPITRGRSDGRMVEALSGLAAGDRIASSNTFVLKSELGKASAGHGH